jgi:hypothetical protein
MASMAYGADADGQERMTIDRQAVVSSDLPAAQPSPHPDTSGPEWKPLFAADLSNAEKPENVWIVEDGVITPNADRMIWSMVDYENFTLDLEFRNEEGTNSGVILYCTNPEKWIPNSVEVQIADPFAEKWAKAPATHHGGGIFGHVPPAKQVTRKPGEWNRMTIQAHGPSIKVWLNGTLTAEMDMAKWTSAKTNPDGSPVPGWLNIPKAEMPTKGRIGLQGKHGQSTVSFRNIRVRLDS